jgi:hypothetical protein
VEENRDPAGRRTREQPRKKTGLAPTGDDSPSQRKLKRGCRGESMTDRVTLAMEEDKNTAGDGSAELERDSSENPAQGGACGRNRDQATGQQI